MLFNKYKYALIDFSYILSRNAFAVKAGKNRGEYTEADLIKSVIQTLAKLGKDYGITADKTILIGDKWSKEFEGYYRTYLVKDYIQYKGDRVYWDDKKVENYIAEGGHTDEEIEKVKDEAYMNTVKYKAKYAIINDLGYFGIPTILVDGWEADDLSWASTGFLYDQDEKPSILVTKDSDWKYNLSPKMDYFSLPRKGSNPEIITYDQMYATLPDEIKAANISLYDYHCITDALGFGHNCLGVSKKSGIDPTKAILKILAGDYSDVENIDMYKTQLSTFNISAFPRFNEVKDIILNKYGMVGHIGTSTEFTKFCEKYNIIGISEQYYNNFVSHLDPGMYKE